MSNPHDLKPDVLRRFLRYVQLDTQSDPRAECYPSTPKQLALLSMLADELRALDVPEVRQDEFGYVTARLPSTLKPGRDGKTDVPTIGFLAHVDTSPDVNGTNVKPQVIEHYDGGVVALSGAPEERLDPAELPELLECKGHTIVTSDGTTLLGADDKSGIAAIMTMAAYLVAHPEVEHAAIVIGFTPDEEIGRGTEHFDIERFGARYAYTLDGSRAGSIEQETFSGDAAEVIIEGRSQHPGYAKGLMVNAIKLAAEYVARLPKNRLSPETTDGREGYVHPTAIQGTVERAVIQLILRDFDDAKLFGHREVLKQIATEVARLDERAMVRVEFSESYRNMRAALSTVPFVVTYAEEAIRRVGLKPFLEPIRGGTDGSRLTAMGLPTPNLFTGSHNYHSRREWADADEMAMAVLMLVELCRVWAEHGADPGR
jgi:tripeptide aminopeptidase